MQVIDRINQNLEELINKIKSSITLSSKAEEYLSPEMLILWKPVLTLLVLIYWNMALPDRVGIFEALLFGLLLDVSTGTLLGLHAALFVLITTFANVFFINLESLQCGSNR